MSENTVKSDLSTSTTAPFDLEVDLEPMLVKYSFAERKAILDHRFFLSIELKRQATFDEAIISWESGVCLPWRREKMRRDRYAQIKEIERHKYFLSMQCGFDIGWEAAALDWIKHHAAAWRDWWERHWWEQQWWEVQLGEQAPVSCGA